MNGKPFGIGVPEILPDIHRRQAPKTRKNFRMSGRYCRTACPGKRPRDSSTALLGIAPDVATRYSNLDISGEIHLELQVET